MPNQLFYLRNWRDPKLQNILSEPSIVEMVKARDRVRVSNKVKKDKDKRGWPKLELGTQVVGQDPTAQGHVC